MRDDTELVNGPSTLHLVHCTSIERGRLIADQGLIPGDQERCNYDANRWTPLEGVYLSQSSNQIEGYRFAHALTDYAIVLVAADPETLLPDEDILDITLGESIRRVLGLSQDAANDDIEPPPPGDPFWFKVRDEFLRWVGPYDRSSLDLEMVDTLVDWWADYEFFEGGDIHPLDWADLKDRVVRAFPRMEGLALAQKSKRHPGPIGFDGPVHITAILKVVSDEVSILKGSIPDEALNLACAMLPGGHDLRRDARRITA